MDLALSRGLTAVEPDAQLLEVELGVAPNVGELRGQSMTVRFVKIQQQGKC